MPLFQHDAVSRFGSITITATAIAPFIASVYPPLSSVRRGLPVAAVGLRARIRARAFTIEGDITTWYRAALLILLRGPLLLAHGWYPRAITRHHAAIGIVRV